MIKTATIDEYTTALAAKTSTPGGGAAAAICGAQALALVEMVCNFTHGNDALVSPILKRAHTNREAMLSFGDQDIICFEALMASYKLSKTTEQEALKRSGTIQSCLIAAATVPLRMIELLHMLVPDLQCLARLGNKNLITDVGISASLTQSALVSSRLNVLINLRQIRDSKFKADAQSSLQALMADLIALQKIVDQISEGLS